MDGHQVLIALRKRGVVPARGVLIEIADAPAWNCGMYAPAGEEPDTVLMSVAPNEDLAGLDFRPVVGLKVLVMAYKDQPNARALTAVSDACVKAGARRVVAVQFCLGGDETVFDYTKGAT